MYIMPLFKPSATEEPAACDVCGTAWHIAHCALALVKPMQLTITTSNKNKAILYVLFITQI